MNGWKDLFRQHILERGLKYFENGAVAKVEKSETGYRAIVEGSDTYQVEIEVDHDRVYDMFCDCPYAESGNYCKHMAAVLYKIEDEEGESSSSNWQGQLLENWQELETVVSKIPENELRQLLIDLAKEDEALRNRIVTEYSETIDARQMARLKQEIDKITYQYSDRYGFIGYSYASIYASEMNCFLYEKVQALIDRGCIMQAFELTNYVFHCVGNQDIDDSGGEIEWMANTCYEFWQQILQKAQKKEQKRIFRWFQEHKNGYVIDYMEEYIEDFLMNEFHDPDMLKQKMKMLDERIEKAGNSTDCGKTYSAHYGFENNIIKRIQIMKELGSSSQEIREYRDRHRKFSEVRKLEIEDYLNEKQYKEAISVLEESKQLDQEYPGLVSEYSQKLIDIYSKTGQQKEYRAELEYQIFNCAQNDLQFIERLKEVCREEEWLQYREKILQSRMIWSVKYAFLESEGLYERLLHEIKDSGSIYALDQYETILKKKYPEAVRDLYIMYIKNHAEKVTDRKNYRELIKYLKKVVAYPEGISKAHEIAGEWRILYKRRSAMMDELKKAGF